MARIYDTEMRSGESMAQWYLRLAGTANKRLERLEKLAEQKYYKPAKQWAYNRAKYDVRKWKPGGKVRFPEGQKWAETASMERIMGAISDVRTFLESATSTKEGIKEVYQKRADTFNAAEAQLRAGGKKVGGYGTKFTWEQLAKYYENKWNKVWENFGSSTALRVIGVLQEHKDMLSFKEKLSKVDISDWRMPGDTEAERKYMRQMVEKALNTKGLHIKDLILK